MNIKFVVIIAIILSFLSFGAWWLNQDSPYEARQVLNVPTGNLNLKPKLDLSQHIRHSIRPKEHVEFPILPGETGPIEPLYAGSMQYPFYCMTIDSGLGQPLVDNQKGIGVTVYDSDENIGDKHHIIGYSKDCSIVTNIRYAARTHDEQFQYFETTPPENYQALYRIERGTINRFIYLIVMPINSEDLTAPNKTTAWNNKLIYQFAGGSGIGFRQGKSRVFRTLERRAKQLDQGYAVITSTGNRTSYTYNMLLAEDIARRVKQQFISLYGEPKYTVGIGGSGGGLSQYLIGQNSMGILDAAIPLYSYSDMVSQTVYALDCDLFNGYYSYRSDDTSYWQNWENRTLVEGSNAKTGKTHPSSVFEPVNQLLSGRWPVLSKGNSVCVNGWFGLSTFVHNPAQGFLREFFADDVVDNTNWNYWQDMAHVFGVDINGFANQTWENVGVQYGLAALKSGKLPMHKFLHLNWHIGSWKSPDKMKPETIIGESLGKRGALWLSLWSKNNITESAETKPAPRRAASQKAIEMAYRSGQVFIGEIDIPILDVRHFLDEKLDMHHMSATFVSRLRMLQAKGHHKNQIVWVADEQFSPIAKAFNMMDHWMTNIQINPNIPIWQVKPKELSDSCFDQHGKIIHSGEGVWNGDWNKSPDGACTQVYTPYSDSRIAAGNPWQGSIFSCHLISVQDAILTGVYHPLNMTLHQRVLEKIFPEGVCDYRFGDKYKPLNL